MNDSPALHTEAEPFSVLPAITKTAGAELLRALVDEVRQMQLGWTMLGEESQNRVIERLRVAVHQAMTLTVRRVASADYDHVLADLDSLTVKEDAKFALKVGRSSKELHQLLDRVGMRVVVVFADPDKFTSGMELVRGDADQPQLPLEDGESVS